MASAKAVVGALFAKMLFRSCSIFSAEQLSPRFRRLILRGPELRDARWNPGDKVQIFLPDTGDLRTYTPVRWHSVSGETELLAYLHSEGPGTRWAATISEGARVQLFGPRPSLAVGTKEATWVVGDETSLGLAWANASHGGAVLEVNEPAETQGVMDRLRLTGIELVQRHSDDAHLDQLVEQTARGLSRWPATRLVLSGRAQAIQKVQAGLRARKAWPAVSKAKAYWAPGKRGLD